jgi:predicted nucleic acid-binding protein
MLDEALAVKAARHYRSLRGKGVTVRGTIDMVIATFCLDGGHALLHDDREFDAMASHLRLRMA